MSVLKSINPTTEELFAEFKEINLSSAEGIIVESSESQKSWSNIDIKKRSKIILDIGNFNSGYCILEDEKVIVINKNKPYENSVRVLSEILSSIKLDNIYIKPYIRELITE